MDDKVIDQIKMDAESAFQAKAEGNINYWNAQPEDPEVIFWKEIWSEGATHQHPIAYSQGLAEGRRQAVEECIETLKALPNPFRSHIQELEKLKNG